MFALKEVVGSLPPITFTALVAVPIMFVLRALTIIIRYINIFLNQWHHSGYPYSVRAARWSVSWVSYILKIRLEILLI